MLLNLTEGWNAELDRGPDWLIVHLSKSSTASKPAAPIADALWSVMQQQFSQRLVIELDEVPQLKSDLIAELLQLQNRISAEGGLLRLCGVSEQAQDAIRISRLNAQLPQYQTRVDAVKGFRPLNPR